MEGAAQVKILLDSGAHSLYNIHTRDKRTLNRDSKFAWYDTTEFKNYLDDYGKFLVNNPHITNYVNVDVITDPIRTWKAQRYLEKEYGLNPIPVIHAFTPLKWVEHYLNKGYDYFGLGGLGQGVTKQIYIQWADKVFDIICSSPDRLPLAKIHGFAMTSPILMRRYPWYSVDSATWIKAAFYGKILLPVFKKGAWDYTQDTRQVKVSGRASKSQSSIHWLYSYKEATRQWILNYLKDTGFKVGISEVGPDKEEIIVEEGILNSTLVRAELNVKTLLNYRTHIPEWPWPFESRNNKGLFIATN